MEKRTKLTLNSLKKKKTDQNSNDEVVKQTINTQAPAPHKTRSINAQEDKVTSQVKRKAKNTSITDEDYQQILSYLNQHYLELFQRKESVYHSLVGIHNQIFAIDYIPLPRINIKRFLGKYTKSKNYRKNLLAGKDRFDLHGNAIAKILQEEVDNIKWEKVKAKKKIEAVKKANHDSLIKEAMDSPIAAKALLSEYLPTEFKDLINLDTLKIEKESFIEDDLKTKFSDIIYSAKTNDEK